jgi:hypothetical protein
VSDDLTRRDFVATSSRLALGGMIVPRHVSVLVRRSADRGHALGLVALRAGQGFEIAYDGPSMRVTNYEAANRLLAREYREGWSP